MPQAYRAKTEGYQETSKEIMARYVKFALPVFVIAAAAAGFFYWQSNTFSLPFPATPQGMQLEKLLPDDISAVFTYFPSDEEERGRMQKLVSAVLQDKADALPVFLAQTFGRNMNADVGLEDWLALTENNLLGFSAAFEWDEKYRRPKTFYLFLVLKNTKSAAPVVNKIRKKQSKVGLIGDVLYFTNAEEEKIVAFLKRAVNPPRRKGRGSLSRVNVFNKFIKKAVLPLSGYVFAQGSMSSFIALHAEEGVLRTESVTLRQAQGDKGVQGDSGRLLSSLFAPAEAYLYKEFRAEDLMMFSEFSRLGDLLSYQPGELQGKSGGTPEEFMDSFKSYTGFDFEKDIKPFMNKGAVFGMHHAGEFLPVMTLLIDASEAPQKAVEAVQKLDAKIPGLISLGNLVLKAKAQEPIFQFQPLSQIENGRQIMFYPSRIPDTLANIPLLKLFQSPILISYGVTSNNRAFVSTHPAVEMLLANSEPNVSVHKFFMEFSSRAAKWGSLALIDFQQIIAYMDFVKNFLKEKELISPKEVGVFELLKKHLVSIEGFFQGTQGDGEQLEGTAFIKVTSP